MSLGCACGNQQVVHSHQLGGFHRVKAFRRLKKVAICSALLAAVMGSAVAVQAAALTWDPGHTPGSPGGGAGVWDLSSTNWSNLSGDVAWTDVSAAGVDTAVFAGTPGLVTADVNLSALGLQFFSAGYTISGSGTLRLGASGIDAGSLYTGTVSLGNNLMLGAAQSWNVGYGANLLVDGAINTNGFILTNASSGNITLSGAITGAGGLLQTGNGTLVLKGNNSFTGAVTFSAGTVILASPTALLGPSTINLGAGTASLVFATDSDSLYNINTNTGANVTLVSGKGSDTVGITHTLGTLALGGGTMNFMADSAITSGTPAFYITTLGLTSGTAGAQLLLNPTTVSVTIGSASISSTANTKYLVLDGTSTGNAITGSIKNGIANATLGLIKSNASTWTLSGSNSYSGTTALNGGVLHLNNQFALQNSALIFGGGTAIFDATAGNAFSVGGLGGYASFVMQNSAGAAMALTINAATDQTLSGSISDGGLGGSLVKNGAGAQIFTGGGTYSGSTTINGGVLEFAGSITSTPSGPISVNSGGTLGVSVGGPGEFTLTGSGAGTIPGLMAGIGGRGNTVMFAAGSGLGLDTTNAGGSITYSGTFGTLNLTKLGANTLVLSSANAVVGTTAIAGGSLQLANANVLQNSTVTINAANGLTFSPGIGTFVLGALAGTANSVLLADTSGAAVTLSVGGNGATTTYSGVLSGAGSLNVAGGNLTLSGSNSFTGGTIVNSGVTVNLAVPGNTGTGALMGILTINSGGTVITSTANALGSRYGHYVTMINVNQGGMLNDTAVGVDQAVYNTWNLNGGTIQSNGGVSTNSTATSISYLVFNGGVPVGTPSGVVQGVASSVNVLPNATTSSVIAGRADVRTGAVTVFNVGNGAVATDLLVSAALTSSGSLMKTGAGTMLMTGVNTNTGTAYVLDGVLQLSGTGVNSGTMVIAPYGAGTFVIDNTTAAGGNNNNRLHDNSTISISGGKFLYQGTDAAGTNSTETVGTISGPGNGALTVAIGGVNSATLTTGNLTHVVGNAAFLVNGTNLGQDSTSGATPRVIVTTTPTLIGTTAALATGINAAAQNTNIVPFLLGEVAVASGGKGTVTGVPNTFVTYIAGSGLRPLNLTDEFIANTITAGNNTYITSATSATASTSINSLILNGADLSIDDGVTLTNRSGALLFTANGTIKPTGTTGIYALGAEGMITTNPGVNATISTPISGAFALTKGGAGTLTLSAVNTYTGLTAVTSGVMNLSGTIGNGGLTVSGATVNLTGGVNSANTAAGGQVSIGINPSGNSILNINGGTLRATKTSSPSLTVAGGIGAQGFIEMTSGTIATTSELHIGNGNGLIGAEPYAVLSMSGGTLTSGSWLVVGFNHDRAILNQSGGSITVSTNRMTIGAGGSNSIGVVNLSGGTFSSPVGILVGEAGSGIVNLSNTANATMGNLQFAGNTSSVYGSVNLMGGLLTTGSITKGTSSSAGAYRFNFNGGTLKASAASTAFFGGADAPLAQTTAYVYSGGGTVDNGGFTVTIGQPLMAPTGSGVSSIAVASGGAGYVDAPLVFLSGGSGSGATAVANVSNGVVTGFTITNPGSGYASTDVLTAYIYGGGATTPATAGTISLASNTGGGMTFTGTTTGTTILTGTSTYTGPTLITGGKLQLSSSGSINGSSGININGGKLVQTSGVPISVPITLTNGTLDGTGTISSTITVASGTGSILANGAGTASPLYTGPVIFNGLATINLTLNSTSPAIWTNGLSTAVAGGIKINITNTGLWTVGTYDLISYSGGSLSGLGLSGFSLGTMTPLVGGRITASLINDTVNRAIALQVAGDNPVWTGLAGGDWTVAAGSGNKNWKLQTAGTSTDFLNGDVVMFDDTAANAGGTTSVNITDPLVTITSVTFNNSGSNYTINGTGGIAGTGTVSVLSYGAVTLNTSNTYSGGTVLGNGNGGVLRLGNASALGTGPLTINAYATLDNANSGPLALSTNNAQVWNGDFTFAGTMSLDMGTGGVSLTGSRKITITNPATLSVGAISDGGSGYGLTLSSYNVGSTLVLNGVNTYTGPTTVSGGTLTINGSLGVSPAAAAGRIVVNDQGVNSILNLNGSTINLALASGGSMAVGAVSGGAGAVFQNGGTVIMPNTTQSNLHLGDVSSAFGYYRLSGGGTLTLNEVDIGGTNTPVSAYGVMDITSGTVNAYSWVITARGQSGAGGGVLNMTGGTLNLTGNTQLSQIWGGSQTGVINIKNASILTTGASGTNSTTLDLNRAGAADSVGVVNLNEGGLLQVNTITAGSSTAGKVAVMNFNGGTLKAVNANTGFMTSGNITGVYVYGGGGTIDNNGVAVTVGRGLLAPTGSGVADTISVLSGGTGYISPPLVTVVGDGKGATAVAEINSNGQITAIRITNPGTDYTYANILITGGGGNGDAQFSMPSLAPNSGGGMSFTGTGTTTLTGSSTYSGPTTVDGGKVVVSGSGSINGSSGIGIINGGKLVQASSVAMTPTVNVTNGTFDGAGTVGTVIVGAGTGTVANGNGGTAPLTIGSLVFNGAATLNLNVASTSPALVTTTLTTSGGSGTSTGLITVNVANALWNDGVYDLISYSSISGVGAADFVKGAITGLTPRQSAALTVDAAHNNAIALSISGTSSVLWSGLINSNWTTSVIPPDGSGNKNWVLQRTGSATDFMAADTLIFDDSAAGTTTVNIAEANAMPTSVVFTNNTKSYTISSTGGFGIANGSLVVNGSGAVTINTDNTYTGGTTVNAGSLALNGSNNFGTGAIKINGGTLTLAGSNTYSGGTTINAGRLNINHPVAIGSGALVINGGTLDASASPIALTTANPQTWAGDFTFAGTNNLTMGTGAVTLSGTGATRTVTVNASQLSVGAINGTGNLTVAGNGTLIIDSSSSGSNGAQSNLTGVLNVTGHLQITSATPAQTGNLGSDFHVVGGLTGNGTIANGGNISRWLYLTESDAATAHTFAGSMQDGGTFALGFSMTGPGTLVLTGANSYTGTTTVATGKLEVATGGALNAANTANVGQLILGNTANANGVLAVTGGTVNATYNTSPSIAVGTVANADGFIKLTSGTINTTNQFHLGRGSGAITGMSMSGGVLNVGSYLVVGFNNDRSVFNQSGGATTVTANFMTVAAGGSGAIGVANLSGGTFTSTGAGGGIYVGEFGVGTLNISGSASVDVAVNGITMGSTSSSATGWVGQTNLLGGTLTTNRVAKGVGTGTASFNFNGGTLKARAANTTFMTGLDSAYIYSGGATIDDGGFAVTIAQPLLNPTGNGVSASGVSVSGGGYLETPIVQVSGDGTGASAVATIDASGNLTGIQITNPGVGYTYSSFSLLGGGYGNTGSVSGGSVTPNQPGKLTKNGTGILTLSGANTYAGGTVVNQGMLVFASTSARPADGMLQLNKTAGKGGKVVVQGDAGNLAAYRTQLLAGYGATGRWEGVSGIGSTSAFVSSGSAVEGVGYMSGAQYILLNGAASFATGYTVNATDVLLRYTYLGDADLDGQITLSDYAQLDAAFLFAPAAPMWTNGDFNYDGLVNFKDYALIDASFAVQSGPLADSMIALHTAQFSNAYVEALQSALGNAAAVPEPASLALLAIGATALLRRKR